jgi:hypothetical protein
MPPDDTPERPTPNVGEKSPLRRARERMVDATPDGEPYDVETPWQTQRAGRSMRALVDFTPRTRTQRVAKVIGLVFVLGSVAFGVVLLVVGTITALRS